MSAVEHGGLGERERAAGIIDLSANLHPDGPPRAVIDALHGADIGHYPAVDAAPLREVLAVRHGVAPECIVVTPGGAAAIALASSLLAASERCAVFEPTFGEYARAIEAAGGVVERVVAPPERIAQQQATPLPRPLPDVAAAWLCVPNNPTGHLVSREEVTALLPRLRLLLLDAAYADLAEPSWDAIELVRLGAPVVVVGSLTKLFAMPGIRVGYLVAPPAIAATLRGRQPPWPVGSADIAAGLAALAGIEERRASVPALHERRRRLEAALHELGLRTTASMTNFVLAEVGDAPRFRASLLTRGFGVRDATSFGLPEWVRMAVPSEAAMAALVEAIRGTVREMRA